jgi:tetratricopeptide (TPR) repeat protein
MRTRKPPPPGAPEGGSKVISIVDQLHRRKLARERERAQAMHLRDLEKTLDVIESTKAIEDADFEAELAKIDAMPPDAARLPRAQIRATRALQSCLRGDPDGGFAEWTEVIAEVPELAYPYLLRARWLSSSDLPAAMADYDRAAIVEPKNPLVYWRRGECHLALGDQDRALANFRRAIGIDPTAIDVLRDMAKLLADRGEHAEARAVYDRAIAQAPRYADFYLGRAQSLEKLGDHDGAIRDYSRILELDPSRTDVLFYRAVCHEDAGQPERAIAEMAKLAELEPGEHHNHRILGKMRLDAGQAALALEDLSRAVALAPDFATTYAHRARAYWITGDKARTLADLDRAIELAPNEPEYVIERALVRLPDLTPVEMRAELDRLVELKPDHAMLLDLRATLLDKEGEHERAIADWTRAIAALPTEADLYEGRAKAYAALSRVEEALADADRVIALAPGHAFGHSMRAAYRRYLEGDEALIDADFDRSVELAPDDPSIRYHRGEHLMDEGRFTAALVDFERVIALAPGIAAAWCGRGTCLLHLDEELADADEDWDEEDEVYKARLRAAAVDLEKAIELGLCNDDVYMELHSAYQCSGDDAAALAALDRAIEAMPETSIFLYQRHHTRKSMGDVEGAAADRARAEALGFKFRDG